jgi:signal transduction histidine kinase
VSTFGKDLWLAVRFVPYTYEGEPHVLALFADMSDRKRAETEREKLQAQLMQSQKMEAVGQLAGGVAHDFNNILTAIIGYGGLLQIKIADDDPLRPTVDQILESADRAAQLTHSLLAFSRKQVLMMKPTNLNGIITRQERFLRRIIGEDIEMRTILRGDAVIMADSGQIEQVLMNLAANARDAMPKGGHLTIETDLLDLTEAHISAHGFDKPGSYAMVSVTDTGMGMDEETKQKIFEPFFTTKEVGRGTGLGLAIIYGIIKQHRGYINVYSQVGRGTTFKIYLPVHSGREEQPERSAAPPPVLTGSETILLAEDDATLRAFFKDILTEYGYTVVIAENGDDAIRKFTERKDEIEACVIDMIMPKKSGMEVFEAVAKIKPGIKFIFSSGYTADKVHREGLPAGTEFITKPASPQAFLKKIRDVLDG